MKEPGMNRLTVGLAATRRCWAIRDIERTLWTPKLEPRASCGKERVLGGLW